MKYPWQKSETSEEFTLPDELQKKIDAGANAAAELPKITELLNGLKSVMESSTAASKKEKEEAAAAEAARKNTASTTELEEKIEELMLSGRTKEAIALANQPVTNEVLLLRADRIKREVFEDADTYPYYSGDIKKEVDALLEGQSVAFRNNAQNVENCYHTVLGKHTKEIVEGKLKTRFAGSDGSRGTSSGSAGSSSTEGKKKTEVTDDIRKAARLTGITPEDYAELLDKEGVGYA